MPIPNSLAPSLVISNSGQTYLNVTENRQALKTMRHEIGMTAQDFGYKYDQDIFQCLWRTRPSAGTAISKRENGHEYVSRWEIEQLCLEIFCVSAREKFPSLYGEIPQKKVSSLKKTPNATVNEKDFRTLKQLQKEAEKVRKLLVRLEKKQEVLVEKLRNQIRVA